MTDSFDDEVVGLLQSGGIGFMPTDTIYGLSARALDEAAVAKIYKIKKRDQTKPLVILISAVSQLAGLGIDIEQAEPAEKYWPGPMTLICKAADAPRWLHRGGQSLAVRLPHYPALLDLIAKTGPLVSTSANIEGGYPAVSLQQAKTYFGEELDFYVDGGDLSDRQSSTIARLSGDRLLVVRAGAAKIN